MASEKVKKKKKRGDRHDAVWLKSSDAMHNFMPYLLKNRTANEAVLNDSVDAGPITAYLEKKNAAGDDFKYTIFHVVLAALAKTIHLRPHMNRYIQGHRYYQRNDISFSFTAKKQFTDRSEEFLVVMKMDTDSEVSPLEQIHTHVKKQVQSVRKGEETDGATDAMSILNKLPRFLLRFVTKILFWMDYHGWLPRSLEKVDPYHTTCFVSNLGSIKMSADYHHLTDWGTCSFFVLIGEKKKRPVFEENGSFEMKDLLPLGFTIDERIADGFYFCRSVKLLRHILQHPEILDETFDSPVEWEEK